MTGDFTTMGPDFGLQDATLPATPELRVGRAYPARGDLLGVGGRILREIELPTEPCSPSPSPARPAEPIEPPGSGSAGGAGSCCKKMRHALGGGVVYEHKSGQLMVDAEGFDGVLPRGLDFCPWCAAKLGGEE